MKKKVFLEDYLKIADIHADRLKSGLKKVKTLFPLTPTVFAQLTDENVAFLDMITTRFGKLQDIIGAKIFPLILEILGEDALSYIDKLNKLEKLGIIEDAQWWMKAREIRNQITHDYPDDYGLLSTHFNQMIPVVNDLLNFWSNLKLYIDSTKLRSS